MPRNGLKVLLLGRGKVLDACSSTCHSCLSQEEYEYIISDAKGNGLLVRLDRDPLQVPDVLATVYQQGWADKVIGLYGGNFDIIIDAICCTQNGTDDVNYESEAVKLLKPDGLFYGWKNGKKDILYVHSANN